MIQAWRLCRLPFANLSGEGGARFGGRWNSPGLPVVYLADHPALAVLEVRVHLDLPLELMPADYCLMGVSLPNELPERIDAPPADPPAAGDAWLRGGTSVVLRVRSTLVPEAWNLLLNPRHPRASEATVLATRLYRFDPRLFG